MKSNNKRAFSLIEILIAIAIAGLAASLIYPVVKGNKDKSAYEISLINLGSIAKAMEHHYLEKGSYPVIKTWDDLSATEGPLAEYLSTVPVADAFGRKYNIKESTETGYVLEGFKIAGKMGKEYPDYSYSTGAKLKRGKKKE